MRLLRGSFVLLLLVGLSGSFAGTAVATPSTYRVQLDAMPPAGEPWAFLRLFPKVIKVHRNDVVQFAWAGTDTPHTATVVPAPDAATWRATNQGPGGPFEDPIVDTSIGGDDGELIENPSVVFPSSFGCGTAAMPCLFKGTSVVSSGLQFSNPGAQPSFDVRMEAPVGRYSFLCLLHPGMEIPVDVVTNGTSIPGPAGVDKRAANQVARAIAVDGAAADAQAQTVTAKAVEGGNTRYDMSAGGFSNGATANEFLDHPLRVHVGDKIRYSGTSEIHTVTFPMSKFKTVPFIVTQCEVPGPDTPAASPLDCADPSKFEVALNGKAISPTMARGLTNPHRFLNSGLLAGPVQHTFIAKEPGTYTFVCLVHGPEMSSTIRVVA